MQQTIKPETEQQLVDVLEWAASERAAMSVIGSGTKKALGCYVDSQNTLELSGLWGLIQYEPRELVLTARAGTPLTEIGAALKENNQFMAFEPMDFAALFGAQGTDDGTQTGTIGGMVAAGYAGLRRISQGGVRDHVLGFRAISGRGEVFKSGGKVMKNVTGFDLSKLMAGSFGTLAVMSEITIKVKPAPEKTRTVLVLGLENAMAVKTMADALNSPNGVTSVAHLPAGVATRSAIHMIADAGEAVTAIRVEGPEPSVIARCQALRELLGMGHKTEELHTVRSRVFWCALRDVEFFKAEVGSVAPGNSQVWRLSVPPSYGAKVLETLVNQCGGEGLFDWGGGLIWYSMPVQPDAAHQIVREALSKCGGHATLMLADSAVRAGVPVFQPQTDATAALAQRIKNGFDPHQILNPGRLYPGQTYAGQ
jgi:glycolate oxidase FAD binding subunit